MDNHITLLEGERTFQLLPLNLEFQGIGLINPVDPIPFPNPAPESEPEQVPSPDFTPEEPTPEPGNQPKPDLVPELDPIPSPS